jgi:hypothetical protein
MIEFNGNKKAYSHPKWSTDAYRAQFIQALSGTITDWTTASIASRIKKDLFDRYNEIYELDARFNMYSLCARDCAAQVRKYVRGIPSDAPIAFIFDRGDEGRGFLIKEMESSGLPSPVFKRSRPDPKLDKDDPFHVQLQACDFAAWELRRGESDRESGKPPQKLRKSLLTLQHKNKIWTQTLEPDLQGLIQSAGIKKRSI